MVLNFQVPGRGEIDIQTVAAGSVLGWSWLRGSRRVMVATK
ncbi:hypothetical protein ACFHWS_20325 [Micromonospora sp. LOL_013]